MLVSNFLIERLVNAGVKHVFGLPGDYVLDNPTTAGYQIDKVFEPLKHYKRPIYIELPRDVAKKPISYDVYKQGTPDAPVTDPENLDEAFQEVLAWLKHAKNPAILAGV